MNRNIRPPAASLVFFSLSWATVAAAPIGTSVQSQVRPNEIDTADEGGQAGGQEWGIGYRLKELRCGAGEVIVGARLRRGDVLDHLQIFCASPRCDAQGCRWTSDRPGMEAGGTGGDLGPLMRCDYDKMVSGFRGIVASFPSFDYAADLEIECAGITGRPTTEGFYPVGPNVRWHHSEGWLGMRAFPRALRTEFTPVVSCRKHGYGATALSVGEADFVRSRVVQAVSLYCGNPPAKPPEMCADLGYSDLAADRILKDEQRPYNCHYYTKTFILGRRPSPDPNPNAFLELPELRKLGYSQVGEASNVSQLAGAKAGDVLLVRAPSYKPLFPWEQAAELSVHSAIVTRTDSAGRIQLTRQKPDANDCITDLTPAQFFAKYNRAEGTTYQLWRRGGKVPTR